MWDRIRELITVLVITWLIWWSADRRVTDREAFSLRVAVRSADQRIYATIESPRPTDLLVTVEGTRGRLEAFRQLLQRSPGLLFEHLLPADQSAIGRRNLPGATVVAESRGFRETGLTIIDVRPPEITVLLDRIEDVSMRVEPDFGSVGVENVVCQPATVEVRRLPGQLAQTRFADRTLRPAAEQAVKQWLAANPDRADFEIELALLIADAPRDVEFAPSDRVRVVGRFVNLFTTARKGPVQVVFAIPPDVQRQYIVKPTDASNLRPDLDVRGPTAAVNQLQPQQILVFVDVLASDAGGSVRTIRRTPRVVLPPGLELAREPREIEFELTERPAPEPNGESVP